MFSEGNFLVFGLRQLPKALLMSCVLTSVAIIRILTFKMYALHYVLGIRNVDDS